MQQKLSFFFIKPAVIKTILIILFLIYNIAPLTAQQGTVSSGGVANGSGGSASYSIGTISYITNVGTGSGAGYLITQGLQQSCSFIAVSVTPGTATTFCEGGSVILTSNATSGNQWYKNGVAISGETAANLNVNTSGSYSVKVIQNICQSAASNLVIVTVNPIPATPVITQNLNELVSSAVSGNQWYLNNNIIAGATGQNYTPTVSGNYTVQVTENNCTSLFSNIFSYISTAIPDINAFGNQIKALPNPVKDKLIITNSSTSLLGLTIRLVDIYGKHLLVLKSNASRIEINMTKYAAGLYIIRIEDRKNKIFGAKMIIKIAD